MDKKITDLERFALEQICRPYQSMMWGEARLEELPCSLSELAELLDGNTEWSNLVLDRIYRCEFWFPHYIKHKIVKVIDRYIYESRNRQKAHGNA